MKYFINDLQRDRGSVFFGDDARNPNCSRFYTKWEFVKFV